MYQEEENEETSSKTTKFSMDRSRHVLENYGKHQIYNCLQNCREEIIDLKDKLRI